MNVRIHKRQIKTAVLLTLLYVIGHGRGALSRQPQNCQHSRWGRFGPSSCNHTLTHITFPQILSSPHHQSSLFTALICVRMLFNRTGEKMTTEVSRWRKRTPLTDEPRKVWTQREGPHSPWSGLELALFPFSLLIPASQDGR